jgi:hypothetical protein
MDVSSVAADAISSAHFSNANCSLVMAPPLRHALVARLPLFFAGEGAERTGP